MLMLTACLTTRCDGLAMKPGGMDNLVHIDRDQASCKFWLSPVCLASNLGFRAPELRDIERLIEDHADDLLKEWEAVHGEPG